MTCNLAVVPKSQDFNPLQEVACLLMSPSFSFIDQQCSSSVQQRKVKNTQVFPYLISKHPVNYIFIKLLCECLQYLISAFEHDKQYINLHCTKFTCTLVEWGKLADVSHLLISSGTKGCEQHQTPNQPNHIDR